MTQLKEAIRLVAFRVARAIAAAVAGLYAAAVVPSTAIILAARHATADWPSDDARPNGRLTPGEVRTTNAADVCLDRHTKQYRHWSRERDDRILAEYGLPPGPHPNFEVDHLIPLDLGGSDEDANLWPEPRRSVEPEWNAERKDRLEWRMADLVCSGQLGLAVAQEAIRKDWTEAYRRYVGEPAP